MLHQLSLRLELVFQHFVSIFFFHENPSINIIYIVCLIRLLLLGLSNLFVAAVVLHLVYNGKVLTIKLAVFFEELNAVVLQVPLVFILFRIILELRAPFFNVLVFIVELEGLAIRIDIGDDVLKEILLLA